MRERQVQLLVEEHPRKTQLWMKKHGQEQETKKDVKGKGRAVD